MPTIDYQHVLAWLKPSDDYLHSMARAWLGICIAAGFCFFHDLKRAAIALAGFAVVWIVLLIALYAIAFAVEHAQTAHARHRDQARDR